MNIMFMGTPDFASCALRALATAYGRSGRITVVTSPDKPRGRSMKLSYTDVKKTALELGFEVFQPENLKKENFLDTLCAVSPDVIVVAAYGKLLPEYVLNFPKYGCVNIHASLLPEYRGAAPINRCIMDGKTVTGITIMRMDKGLDTGDILLSRSTEIDPEEDAGSLFDRLCGIGAQLIVEALDGIVKGTITPTKQDDSRATYAAKLDTAAQTLDFSLPPVQVKNIIRGLSPYPAALTRHKESGKIVKIFRAHEQPGSFEDALPGQIVLASKQLGVACGGGVLIIDELAMEGSKRMNAVDFINGRKVAKGDRFI